MNMPLTKIESLLYGLPPKAYFIAGFTFAESTVRVRLVPAKTDEASGVSALKEAVFSDAVITEIEDDESERASWPLDPIGFDCYEDGDRWRFVLNCSNVEWVWKSQWPAVIPLPDLHPAQS